MSTVICVQEGPVGDDDENYYVTPGGYVPLEIVLRETYKSGEHIDWCLIASILSELPEWEFGWFPFTPYYDAPFGFVRTFENCGNGCKQTAGIRVSSGMSKPEMLMSVYPQNGCEHIHHIAQHRHEFTYSIESFERYVYRQAEKPEENVVFPNTGHEITDLDAERERSRKVQSHLLSPGKVDETYGWGHTLVQGTPTPPDKWTRLPNTPNVTITNEHLNAKPTEQWTTAPLTPTLAVPSELFVAHLATNLAAQPQEATEVIEAWHKFSSLLQKPNVTGIWSSQSGGSGPEIKVTNKKNELGPWDVLTFSFPGRAYTGDVTCLNWADNRSDSWDWSILWDCHFDFEDVQNYIDILDNNVNPKKLEQLAFHNSPSVAWLSANHPRCPPRLRTLVYVQGNHITAPR